MTTPLVSVILPVYNGARDVPAAVQSILAQTFADFELIAINDGSTRDNTREVLDGILESTGDRRLRIVHLDNNVGLAAALNHGIVLARGALIARQDHDDLSHPTRLAKQIAFLDANPACGLVGTRAEIRVGDRLTYRAHDHAADNATLQLDLLFNNPFVHSSVMFPRAVLDVVGLYTTEKDRQPPEDYELWSRISRRFEVANLPERLLVYREVTTSISRTGPNPFTEKLMLFTAENIAFRAGLVEPDSRCRDAGALAHAAYNYVRSDCDIEGACAVLRAATDGIISNTQAEHLRPRAEGMIAILRQQFDLARLPEADRTPSALRKLAAQLPAPVKTWLRRHLPIT